MPLAHNLRSTYFDRVIGWRTIQADHKLRESRFLTLQELANLVGLSKQTTRYFCRKRGIPYSAPYPHGYYPEYEELRKLDLENGLKEYMARQKELHDDVEDDTEEEEPN